jgi:hypothetical protein
MDRWFRLPGMPGHSVRCGDCAQSLIAHIAFFAPASAPGLFYAAAQNWVEPGPTFAPSSTSLWPAAQEAPVVAVAIPDVAAAVRNSRAIKKLIGGAAVMGAIKAAVVESTMISKFRRQVFCPVPVEQRPYTVSRCKHHLARMAAGHPKKKGKNCEADRSCPARDLPARRTNKHEVCNRPIR